MPCVLRSASCFSCETVSGAAAGAGGGAWAYCCCAYCWSSCAAHRLPCRRDTRFDTAVAVPATTAVRATPRRSPGIGQLLLCASSAVGGVERRRDGFLWDVSGGDDLRAPSPQRLRERGRPPVLEDEDCGGRPRVDDRFGVRQVAAVEQSRGSALEDGKVELAVVIEIAQLDGADRAVRVARDEHEVEDADQATVDEVDEDRESFTGHLVPGKLNDQIADRSHRIRLVRHCPTTSLG